MHDTINDYCNVGKDVQIRKNARKKSFINSKPELAIFELFARIIKVDEVQQRSIIIISPSFVKKNIVDKFEKSFS